MMKNLTLLVLSLLFVQLTKAQVKKNTSNSVDTTIYSAVQQEPSFPNGSSAFYKFLYSKIDFSKDFKEKGETGKAIILL